MIQRRPFATTRTGMRIRIRIMTTHIPASAADSEESTPQDLLSSPAIWHTMESVEHWPCDTVPHTLTQY